MTKLEELAIENAKLKAEVARLKVEKAALQKYACAFRPCGDRWPVTPIVAGDIDWQALKHEDQLAEAKDVQAEQAARDGDEG